MLVGIGATHYSPGDPVTLPATTPLTSIDSATKFAWTLGGGVKVYPAEHVGLRLNARWTPTYIKSDAEGLWCDPCLPDLLGPQRGRLFEPVLDQRRDHASLLTAAGRKARSAPGFAFHLVQCFLERLIDAEAGRPADIVPPDDQDVEVQKRSRVI